MIRLEGHLVGRYLAAVLVDTNVGPDPTGETKRNAREMEQKRGSEKATMMMMMTMTMNSVLWQSDAKQTHRTYR